MDPQATWEQLLSSYGDRQLDDARRAAGDLLGWLSRGGFPPTTTELVTPGDELHRVIALAVCRQVLGPRG